MAIPNPNALSDMLAKAGVNPDPKVVPEPAANAPIYGPQDASDILAKAKEEGEKARAAAAKPSSIILEEPSRARPVPAALAEVPASAKGGSLAIENAEASNALERAKAAGEAERAATAAKDPLLKAHLEGARAAVTEDTLLHASEVGKARAAANRAASPDGRLEAAQKEGLAREAEHQARITEKLEHAKAQSPSAKIEAAHNGGVAERAANASAPAPDPVKAAHDAAVAEREAERAAHQGRIEKAHAQSPVEEANARLRAAHAQSPVEEANARLKAAHAQNPAEEANARLKAAHDAGARSYANESLETAHAQSPDARIKAAHDAGVAERAANQPKVPHDPIKAAHDAGVAEREVPKVPEPKSVAQLTKETTDAAKAEVAKKAGAEGAKLAAEDAAHAAKGTAFLAEDAAKAGTKVAAGTTMLAEGATVLGKLARAAKSVAPAAAVVGAGLEVAGGFVNHDDVAVGRGIVKGAFGAVGGALGFVAGSGLPVIGNVALSAAGAAAGEKVGDVVVDAMTGTGLTDRGGRKIVSDHPHVNTSHMGTQAARLIPLVEAQQKERAVAASLPRGQADEHPQPAEVRLPVAAAPSPAAPKAAGPGHDGHHNTEHTSAGKPVSHESAATGHNSTNRLQEQLKADSVQRSAHNHPPSAHDSEVIGKLQGLSKNDHVTIDDIRKKFFGDKPLVHNYDVNDTKVVPAALLTPPKDVSVASTTPGK